MSTTLTCNFDCYLDSGLPTTNTDTSNPQNAGILNPSNLYHGLIGFDGSAIPYPRVRKAILRFYQTFVIAGTARNYMIDPTVPVIEAEATWNKYASGFGSLNDWTTPGGDVVGTYGVTYNEFEFTSGTNQYKDVDVTNWVNQWLANPTWMGTGRLIFMIVAANEGGGFTRNQYQPRNGANPAQLVLTPPGTRLTTIMGGSNLP